MDLLSLSYDYNIKAWPLIWYEPDFKFRIRFARNINIELHVNFMKEFDRLIDTMIDDIKCDYASMWHEGRGMVIHPVIYCNSDDWMVQAKLHDFDNILKTIGDIERYHA